MKSDKDPLKQVDYMARVGLAVYLMFTTAAGPWLCCCSGDRLFARLFAAKPTQTTTSRCCNHHAPGGGQRVPGDKKHPETPTPYDPCPCQDGTPNPIAILVANSSIQADFARPFALSQEFVPGIFAVADPFSWHEPAENSGFAFAAPLQNPRDILSLLQTLRC